MRPAEWGTQTDAEEWANTLTHGFGLAGALAGGAWVMASVADAPRVQAGVGVYLASIIAVFASSTAYHKATDARWKRWLNVADRVAIHLAIAGGVTPFMLAQGHDAALAGVWSAAAGGVFYEGGWGVDYEKIATATYLTVGAFAVGLGAPALLAYADQLGWVIGGLASVLGGLVFFWLRDLPYHHTVWHVFVIGGLFAHTVGVYAALAG